MKIFDCFQFFDENMMLDFRLNTLSEHVHKFVIVENAFMHSGIRKDPVFNIKNFSKFKDKIIYIFVDKLPDGLYDIDKIHDKEKGNRIIDNTLMIEHAQRNSIIKGFLNCSFLDLSRLYIHWPFVQLPTSLCLYQMILRPENYLIYHIF